MTIHKKRDGYLLIDPTGRVRYLGFWESIAYQLGWKTADDFTVN